MGPSWWSTLFYTKPTDATEVTDSVGGRPAGGPAQPAQKYPFVSISAPRVDNKNQPWYGGPRWWGSGPDDIQNTDAVTTDSAGQANYDLASTWLSFDKWFGGATPKANLISQQDDVVNPPARTPMPMQMGRLNMSDQSGNVLPWSVDDNY